MYDSRSKKQEEEFMSIVDDVRISTQETIEKLKREPGDKEAAIEAISLMQKRLDKIKRFLKLKKKRKRKRRIK